MSGKPNTGTENRLQALLRRGDPASDAVAELPASTLTRMRARVVSAAASRPRIRMAPFAWAAAAAAGVLLLALVLLRPEAPYRASPPASPGRPSGVAAPPGGPAEERAGQAEQGSHSTTEPPVARAPKTVRQRTTSGASPSPLGEVPPAAGAPVPQGAPEVRSVTAVPARSEPLQLQFTTPGGTRIIWTLDPEFNG